MATQPCGTCKHYWALRRAQKSGTPRKLKNGPCLKRSVYPKSRAKDQVYPPRAKFADLPNMTAEVYMVNEAEVISTCPWWEKRGVEEPQ
jgi:hypothetical protein